MRRRRVPAFLVLILALLFVASISRAQTTAPAAPGRDPQTLIDRVRRAAEGVRELTDEQKQRIDDILKQAKADLDALLPTLRDSSQAERQEKLRDFMTKLREQVLPVLSDEQKQQFQELIREVRQGAANAGAAVGAAGGGMRQRMTARLEELIDKLDLTQEQKDKYQAILAETREKMAKAREEAQGDLQAMRERGQAVFRETREKLEGILTPEQRQKMRDMIQELRPQGARGPRDNEQPATQPAKEPEKPKPTEGGGAGAGTKTGAGAAAVPAVALSPPPVPGQVAPALALEKLDGSPVQLSSFKDRLALLAFGSYSSPSFRSRAQGLEELRREYGARVNFVVVYTREAHPSGGWEVDRNRDAEISVQQPADANARRNAAKQARDLLKLQSTITTDSMDDTTARAYHAFPNDAAVLIGKDGNVLAYQEWFDPYGMRQAIVDAMAPAPSTRATRG